MKIIAIKEMSAGNESVGEMWQETKIFNSAEPIMNIFKWAGLNKKITITIPEDDKDEFNRDSENAFANEDVTRRILTRTLG